MKQKSSHNNQNNKKTNQTKIKQSPKTQAHQLKKKVQQSILLMVHCEDLTFLHLPSGSRLTKNWAP